MFSSVPRFVIWLTESEANGTGRGQKRQAAKTAAASNTSTTIPVVSGRDLRSGRGTVSGFEPEAGVREPEAGVREAGPRETGGGANAGDPPLILRCKRFRSARSSAAD